MTVSREPRILIVSTKHDLATDSVVLRLHGEGVQFYRLNTEDLPSQARASYLPCEHDIGGTWRTCDGDDVAFGLVRAVWFRRQRLPPKPKGLANTFFEYSVRECEWFLRGLLYTREAAWMSPPLSLQRAESKMYQLVAAVEAGFLVPATLVSNDPSDIRAFYAREHGDVVAKPLRLGYFDYGHSQTCVFTSSVSQSDLDCGAALSCAPVIYQKRVQKVVDIRVTVVGEQVFAAEIDSQSEPTAALDWRQADAKLPLSRHRLPDAVCRSCIALLRSLDLSFGAIDLVLDPDGDYWFLEVNPNGQWLWIEDELDYPISEAVASWLTRHAM